MIITARPGESFDARVTGFPSGLVGTVRVRILDNEGGTTLAATAAGIIEDPAGSGSYATTLVAPAEGGQYSVLWDTGTVGPSSTASDDLLVTLAPIVSLPAGITPTLAEVGALTRTRTRDTNGVELGTFTDETRPTGDQVALLIQDAVGEITDLYGDNLPTELESSARKVAKLRSAMLVELSFFGDQIAQRRSPYAEIKQLHDEAVKQLAVGFKAIGTDAEPGTGDDVGAGMPAYYFPALETVHVPGSELPTDW